MTCLPLARGRGSWQIVTGSFDKTAKLWDANTGQSEPKEAEGSRERHLSPHLKVHSHSQGPPHGDCLCCLQCTGACRLLRKAVFSRLAMCDAWQGTHVATGSMDNTAKLWDVLASVASGRRPRRRQWLQVETGHQIASLDGHSVRDLQSLGLGRA